MIVVYDSVLIMIIVYNSVLILLWLWKEMSTFPTLPP